MTHATNFFGSVLCRETDGQTDFNIRNTGRIFRFPSLVDCMCALENLASFLASTLSGTYAFVALPKRNNLFVVILECYKTERRIRINVDTTVYRCWHKRSHFVRMCPLKNSWRERAGGGFALSNILI